MERVVQMQDCSSEGKIGIDYNMLSKELIKEFGRGFSRSNMKNMRVLYLKYDICQTDTVWQIELVSLLLVIKRLSIVKFWCIMFLYDCIGGVYLLFPCSSM